MKKTLDISFQLLYKRRVERDNGSQLALEPLESIKEIRSYSKGHSQNVRSDESGRMVSGIFRKESSEDHLSMERKKVLRCLSEPFARVEKSFIG